MSLKIVSVYLSSLILFIVILYQINYTDDLGVTTVEQIHADLECLKADQLTVRCNLAWVYYQQ